MSRSYHLKSLIIIFLSLFLFACGGGSSGGKNQSPASTSISGTATKGPIHNANVSLYEINSDGSQGAIVAGPFITDDDGNWQGTVPTNTTAPLLVIATDGSYIDEASGATVVLGAGEKLSSFITSIPSDGSALSASISPLSHAMTLSAQKMALDGKDLTAAFTQVKNNASNTFGFDPSTETLFDPSNMPSSATAAQQKYAALLGGISNLAKDAQDNHGAATVGSFALVDALAKDLADGKLDGNGIDGLPISVGSMNLPPLDVAGLDALKDQANTFAGTQDNIEDSLVTDLNSGSLNTNPTSFSITGEVVGANSNVSWQLLVDNALHEQGSSATGIVDFTNSNLVADSKTYNLELTASPTGQSCLVENAEAIISADVSNIIIRCTDIVVDTYAISATFSGLNNGVNLLWELRIDGVFYNDGGDPNGVVTLHGSNEVVSGKSYALTVTNPTGQQCQLVNATGTVASEDVTNISVNCTDIVANSYAITGTITGASSDVAWQLSVGGTSYNNGSNGIGAVTFSGANDVAESLTYSLSVSTAPAGQTCNVSNANGTVTEAVSNIVINCQDQTIGATALYDFSQYDFNPSNPNLVPSPPQSTALDPTDKIASLYDQLRTIEKAKFLAAFNRPANATSTITEIYADGYVVLETTPDNSWIRTVQMSPGADRIPDTEDDIIQSYNLTLNVNGMSLAFKHAGADDTWFTADDVIDGYEPGFSLANSGLLEYQGASEGAVLSVGALKAGADRDILTLDDIPFANNYQVMIIDGESNRGQVVVYDGAGTDGLWFTDDDVVDGYSLVSFDGQGNQVASVYYNGKGLDGVWFTTDDTVFTHTQLALDANYKPTYAVTYNGRGSDSTWFTADDTILSMSYYGYTTNDEILFIATHTNKGNDGIWFTADDTAMAVVELKNAQGFTQISANLTGMGADGKWLSGDETVSYYTYADYDVNGNQTHRADFNSSANGAGADGLWFTSDDQAYGYNVWQREYDQQGRILLDTRYDVSLASAPAFSNSQVSRYTRTVYDYPSTGKSAALSVYRHNVWADEYQFGPDGEPFTADDMGAYGITTANGSEEYNGAGADGQWFTADDELKRYYVETFSGNRLASAIWYEGAGSDGIWKTSDDEVNPDISFEAENIQGNGDHDFINMARTSKRFIEEDTNGYPLWTTEYTLDENDNWTIYNITYSQRDSLGRALTTAAAYSPGTDGIWRTTDDFSQAYGTTGFNVNGDALNAVTYTSAGEDGIWFTADDVIRYDYIYAMQTSPNDHATNNGFAMASCADIQQATTGDIAIEVRDGSGNALSDVTIMLGDAGPTVTSNAQGEATLSAVTGNQDIHLFKDGYTWESFLCVEPAANATVRAVLHNITDPAISKVAFTLSGTKTKVLLMLLDSTTGERLDIATPNQDFTYSYQTLYFPKTADSTVTGELWAFQTDSQGRFNNAESLGEQTYTTLATTASDYGNYEDVELNFIDPQPGVLWQSQRGVDSSLNQTMNGTLSYGIGLGSLDITLPYVYGAANTDYKYVQTMPDVVLPALVEPLALRAKIPLAYPGYGFNKVSSETPMLNDGVFKASFISNLSKAPLMFNQQDSRSTPSISWLPAKLSSANEGTVTSLELFDYGQGFLIKPRWSIHGPAGVQEITLPEPPAGITDASLDKDFYYLRLSSYIIEDLNYQQLLLDHTAQQLPLDLNYEGIAVGGAAVDMIRLNR